MYRKIALTIAISLSACSSRIASKDGPTAAADAVAQTPVYRNDIDGQTLTEAHKDYLRNKLYPALVDRLRFLKAMGQPVSPGALPTLPAPESVLRSQNHIWQDTNGNRTFEAGIDTVLLGAPPEGAWGRRDRLGYIDRNLNGVYDQEELVQGVDEDRAFLRKMLSELNGLMAPSLDSEVPSDLDRARAWFYWDSPLSADTINLGKVKNKENLFSGLGLAEDFRLLFAEELRVPRPGTEEDQIVAFDSPYVADKHAGVGLITSHQLEEAYLVLKALNAWREPIWYRNAQSKGVHDLKYRMVERDTDTGWLPGWAPWCPLSSCSGPDPKLLIAKIKFHGQLGEWIYSTKQTQTFRFKLPMWPSAVESQVKLFKRAAVSASMTAPFGGFSASDHGLYVLDQNATVAPDSTEWISAQVLPQAILPEDGFVLPEPTESGTIRKLPFEVDVNRVVAAYRPGFADLPPPPSAQLPLLFEHTAQTIQDTDRDDLVDVGIDLDSAMKKGGVITFQPKWGDEPQVFLPILPPNDYQHKHLGVAHYIHQGAMQKATDNIQYEKADDTLFQAYSLNTRVRNAVLLSHGGVHLKRVVVTRPRGNQVEFDFPWDPATSNFASRGFPLGINAGRTYVLHDMTPGHDTDWKYELHFESGIAHVFDRTIQRVRHIDGREQNVYSRLAMVSDGQATSDEYKVYLDWSSGRIKTLRRVFGEGTSDEATLTTTVQYDAEGRIQSLIKDDADESFRIVEGDENIIRLGPLGTGVAWTKSGETIETKLLANGRFFRQRTVLTPHGYTKEIHRSISDENGAAVSVPPEIREYQEGTTLDRYENGALKMAKVQRIQYPDGYWEEFEYDAVGKLLNPATGEPELNPTTGETITVSTGWLSRIIRPFGHFAKRETKVTYSPLASAGDTPDARQLFARPRRVLDLAPSTGAATDSIPISVGRFAFKKEGDRNTPRYIDEERRCQPGVAWDACVHRKVTERSSAIIDGEPKVSVSNRTRTTVGNTTITRERRWPHDTRRYSEHLITEGPGAGGLTHRNEESVTLSYGHAIQSTWKVTRGDTLTGESVATDIGPFGHPTTWNHDDGTSENLTQTKWHGQPEQRTHRDLSVSTYTYTVLGQPQSMTRFGRTTKRDYDATGNLIQETLYPLGEGAPLTTKIRYDALGRPVFEADAEGHETTTQYHPPGFDGFPGTITETHQPDGSRRLEYRNVDRNLNRVETYVAGEQTPYRIIRYRHRTGETGPYTETLRPDAEGNLTVVKTEAFNHLGLLSKVSRPHQGELATTRYAYDAHQRLTQETDPDGVVHLYAYDLSGQLTKTVTDLNQNGVADANDPLLDIQENVATCPEGTSCAGLLAFVRKEAKGSFSNRAVTTSYSTADRRKAARIQNGTVVFNYSRGLPTGPGAWRERLATPDVIAVQEYEGGQLKALIHKTHGDETLSTYAHSYDAYGRRTQSQTPEGTTTHTLDRRGLPKTTEMPSGTVLQRTFNFFGNVQTIQGPGGMEAFQYHPDGALARRSGTGSYTYDLEYDRFGEVSKLVTNDDVETIFERDERGLVTQKTVDGIPVESHKYTPAGRLHSRTIGNPSEAGARTATSEYDDAGRLTSFGGTPLAYDPRGRVTLVGQSALTYTEEGRIATESVPQLGDATLKRHYDAMHRLTALELVGGPHPLVFSYAYDDAGRLSRVSQGQRSGSYAYETQTQRVAAITHSVADVVRGKTELAYDESGRLTLIRTTDNQVSDAAVVYGAHKYSYNASGQVTRTDRRVYNTAALFAPSQTYTRYSYDTLGQLTSASTRISNTGELQSGRQFHYVYDAIGNRLKAGAIEPNTGEPEDSYQPSSTNQYETRNLAGALVFSGSVDEAASLTVSATRETDGLVLADNAPVDRHGSWFHARIAPGPAQGGDPIALQFKMVMPSPTGEGELVSEHSESVRLPRSGETTQSYNTFGARKTDGEHIYTWTNRGRLKTVTKDGQYQLRFGYDAFGRRTSKSVWKGANYSVKTLDRRFVYHNFHLIAEYDADPASGALTRRAYYLWGLDSSHKKGGAGGARGLLAVGRDGQSYFPVMDRNGSVTALVSGDGQVVSQYEYSPFGRLMASRGLDIQPFRYGTQYYDRETQLYAYTYRYYDPAEGRWLSRDPLGEASTKNLYAFLDNDPINRVDLLGATAHNLDGHEDQGVHWMPDDRKFNPVNAHLTSLASIIAYDTPANVRKRAKALGFENVRTIDKKIVDAQAFTAYDPKTNTALVAFRGTFSVIDGVLDLWGAPAYAPDLFGSGSVHAGFLAQFLAVKPDVLRSLQVYQAKNPERLKIVVTGHSLGGALATLFSAYGLKRKMPITATYTVGQPPVGNTNFHTAFKENLKTQKSGFFRTAHNLDLVPQVGAVAPWLRHDTTGDLIYIDRNGASHFNPSILTTLIDKGLRLTNPKEAFIDLFLFRQHKSLHYEALQRATGRTIVGR